MPPEGFICFEEVKAKSVCVTVCVCITNIYSEIENDDKVGGSYKNLMLTSYGVRIKLILLHVNYHAPVVENSSIIGKRQQ